jgi:peptidoglycan/xylan/chitin deacetylase (PgdA/CDA1 family)
MSEQEEREHIHLAFEGIKALTGAAPVGWFDGRPSINTRRLVIEHGDFLYDRDYLGDELPFWVRHDGRHHLVIPFSFETNDNRFDQNNGFSTADDFATYLNDCFDLLYEEGAETPKIMTVSLHDRLIGRPAKAVGLMKFLDHARKYAFYLRKHPCRDTSRSTKLSNDRPDFRRRPVADLAARTGAHPAKHRCRRSANHSLPPRRVAADQRDCRA